MEHVSVKYIGKRPFYVEGAYGTRILFMQGESKLVPADKAKLMLRHPDVYVPGKADAPIAAVQAEAQVDGNSLQDMRDAIAAMPDKQSLAAFAQNKYGIKLDQRRAIEDLRLQAIGLVDQYGPV